MSSLTLRVRRRSLVKRRLSLEMTFSSKTSVRSFWITRGTSSARRTVVFTKRLTSGKYLIIRLFVVVVFIVYSDLSDRLNLSRDEGEKYIVNLIRETRMGADAKIDLEKVTPPSLIQLPQI